MANEAYIPYVSIGRICSRKVHFCSFKDLFPACYQQQRIPPFEAFLRMAAGTSVTDCRLKQQKKCSREQLLLLAITINTWCQLLEDILESRACEGFINFSQTGVNEVTKLDDVWRNLFLCAGNWGMWWKGVCKLTKKMYMYITAKPWIPCFLLHIC